MTSTRLTLFAVILTFGTGAVDAASFVRLGGVVAALTLVVVLAWFTGPRGAAAG
ncbi:hypothetical protein [Microtetraspora malaysiensis]|uniref:hypothetical protein n=1 Tax=Microtetraspora malaysiensis TaxID=161358 RepID=UPI003D91E6A9